MTGGGGSGVSLETFKMFYIRKNNEIGDPKWTFGLW